MATTVEFKTGNRRLIEFVFSPLVEITATALHER
jgi:hemolysin D